MPTTSPDVYGVVQQALRTALSRVDRDWQRPALAIPHTTFYATRTSPAVDSWSEMDWTPVLVALVSVALGWTLSLVTQQRQHRLDLKRFDREQDALQENALRARGHALADEMIECLAVLRDVVPQTVHWDRQDTDAEAEQRAGRELTRLRSLALRHPDEAVRSTAQLAYEVLQWPDDIVMWGGEGYGSPREVVWHTCERTLEVVGQYVRGESVNISTAELERLREAQDVTLAEKRSQWEAQALAERPRRDAE